MRVVHASRWMRKATPPCVEGGGEGREGEKGQARVRTRKEGGREGVQERDEGSVIYVSDYC